MQSKKGKDKKDAKLSAKNRTKSTPTDSSTPMTWMDEMDADDAKLKQKEMKTQTRKKDIANKNKFSDFSRQVQVITSPVVLNLRVATRTDSHWQKSVRGNRSLPLKEWTN